jgi:hypothetical protein
MIVGSSCLVTSSQLGESSAYPREHHGPCTLRCWAYTRRRAGLGSAVARALTWRSCPVQRSVEERSEQTPLCGR